MAQLVRAIAVETSSRCRASDRSLHQYSSLSRRFEMGFRPLYSNNNKKKKISKLNGINKENFFINLKIYITVYVYHTFFVIFFMQITVKNFFALKKILF